MYVLFKFKLIFQDPQHFKIQSINPCVTYKLTFTIKVDMKMKLLYVIVMIIVLMDSILSKNNCRFNTKVLKALNKSVGLLERNYSSVASKELKGFIYLECTVFHLNFILCYNFLFYFNFFNLIF